MCQYSEPYEINHKGKTTQVSAYLPEMADYDIIAKNEEGMVVRASYPIGAEHITMHIFEGENSMYGVGLSTEEFGQPGNRTYFKRVPPVEWESVCKY